MHSSGVLVHSCGGSVHSCNGSVHSCGGSVYRSGGSVHSCGGSVATHTRYEEVHGSVRKYGVFFNREVVKHLLLKTVIGLLIRESE